MSPAALQTSPATFYLDQCNSVPVGRLPPPPFPHPVRSYSSCLMSQRSLETCTECLGSETGSDGFSSPSSSSLYSVGDGLEYCHSFEDEEEEEGASDACTVESGRLGVVGEQEVMASVKYHCSVRRQSPARSFPPPLTSISRRDAPCVQLRSHRDDGRLVVEAIAVPCRNYLHTRRVDGRLVISLVEAAAGVMPEVPPEQGSQSEELEGEEMEVVDRGSVVEVKASGKPKKLRGGVKAHRSALIISKFVGGTNHQCEEEQMNKGGIADDKMLSIGKRRKRKEVLKRMRRCSELRRPLCIWEPCYISSAS
ncbi:hypothetical protein ZIOFF_039334 [Zingiber officinale]|uniref:FAF domain-containing protein n=1 Tax=Zingiber officinale TaxID=94328 RepID=A0A8J5G6Z4_ZINOF|nr:hypothetical protein ZIOFF_039334 [Zingiber officinale]